MKLHGLFILSCCILQAETRTLTLKQAMEIVLQQNPDVVLARLEEQRVALEAKAVAEPLLPRIIVGSGLAWTSGFPLSIEGSAPSIVRAQATRSLFNREQTYQVAQQRELGRAASLGTASVHEDAALRMALLFLDVERLEKGLEIAKRQVENQERVSAIVRQRVSEGREIEIESKKAALNVARARQRVAALTGQSLTGRRALSRVLGFPPADEVQPAPEDRQDPLLPANEEEGVQQALTNSKEVRKIESELVAKGLQIKSIRAARLPKVDLVAQYALFGRFNNYEDYFRTFSRHNGQLGASVQVPVFPDARAEAQATQAEIEGQKLRTELASRRSRVESDARKAWQQLREAESVRDVARLDLEVAREQVSVLLAQMEEGRVSTRQVEEARFLENERWLLFYDARGAVERARFELLRETGTLTASLR